MKPRTLISMFVALAALAGGGWWWYSKNQAAAQPQLRTGKIERGTLTATVAASGTLAATVQVQVSSQVSGQIREVLADFNSEVKKGQVLARIDPETFEYRVRQAEADVEAARAQVGVQQATVMARKSDLARNIINRDEARRDFDRKTELVERNFISIVERDKAGAVFRALEQDVASSQAQIELAEAQVRNARSTVQQREALLASARVDLSRTIIRAPVDGVVIKRSIEPGQTVAVSLAAPELFLIAQNLRDMQVEVSIDEAEVSRLRVGQKATFTVDAFPGRTFEGAITQVRKASLNVQNVITYTALVSASNDNQTLLPGMTANVRVITDVREGVLKVPNASLRFKPPGWTEPPKTSALEAGPLRAALESLLPAAQAQGQGGGLQAYRERLERDLALTDAQKASVDGVFSSMRERFMGLRDLEPSERAAASEKLRNEMRSKVAAVLDPGQKKTFAAINAEIDARRQAAQAERAAGTSAATGASSPASGTSAGAGTGTTAPAAAPSRNAPAATSATAGAGAAAGSAAAGAVSASPSPSAAAPKSDAKPSTPAASGTGGAGSAGGATGGGGPLRAFRDRLERDLAFTESQRGQLDGIFSAMRERFATVREAPEADRPKLTETYRAELRARINDILDETQKKKYAEILVELAGRNVSRGRVFIAGPDGKPMPVDVRLGLSDGVATELIGTIGERKLAEGDLVYVGVVGAASKPGPATPPMRPAGPRL
jgi:HlyD family secretion protein